MWSITIIHTDICFVIKLQFLGTWYEVERSFYLPELASSCTMLTFEQESNGIEASSKSNASSPLPSRLEVAVKSINQW